MDKNDMTYLELVVARTGCMMMLVLPGIVTLVLAKSIIGALTDTAWLLSVIPILASAVTACIWVLLMYKFFPNQAAMLPFSYNKDEEGDK